MLRNGLAPWHLLVVIAVLLVLFGSAKLPDAARSLGRSMRILKAETRALRDEHGTATTPDTPTEPVTAPPPRTDRTTGAHTPQPGTPRTP
ncbi:Sec-independent protein translocase subunit TatA [Kitasatospora purpeofusca]|uniref:Sec-independent protein translocase subunit TatA n=1 Tax=Kitasatospora purpeofusca TaxID=67352 RepID=UPI00366A0F89